MTTGDAGSPKNRLGSIFDALFGEAWELERRRRRHLLRLLLSCCGTAVVIALAFSSGGSSPSNIAAAGAGSAFVASHRLPLSADYTGLSRVHGQLVLIDYGGSAPQAANGGTCRTAIVDTHSLRLSSITGGACDDPVLFHRRVIEIDQWNRSAEIRVRIATTDPRAHAGYTVGPALVTYRQCSDCWDASIYGPRSLWVYAPFATPGFKAKGELFRISERTGKVQHRWSMPSITRPLLAVDADGLWMTSSIDGGGPGVLYHVDPGASGPESVVKFSTAKNPGLPARFLIATGHTVWFETYLAGQGSMPRLWRLDGTNVTVRGEPVRGGADCTDSGEGPSTVLGTVNTGFYCVALAGWLPGQAPTIENVFRILPNRREQQQVTTVTPPPGSFAVQAAATVGRSYYFLDPRTQTAATYSGRGKRSPSSANAGRLFRITPR